MLGGTTALCFQHSWKTQEGDGEKYGHISRATSQSALQRNVAFTLKAIGVIESRFHA